MTEAQRKHFYFPAWLKTAAALDWRMVGGRLLANLEEQLIGAQRWPDHARDLVTGIITNAQQTAARERRAVNADDLRHSCNWAASSLTAEGHLRPTGGKSSATRLTNSELNQFVRICGVLRDPWNLTATIAAVDPAEDNRQRTIAYLRKLTHEARLIAIARNAWGTADWESLEQARLDALVAEIKKNAWKRPVRQAQGRPVRQA